MSDPTPKDSLLTIGCQAVGILRDVVDVFDGATDPPRSPSWEYWEVVTMLFSDFYIEDVARDPPKYGLPAACSATLCEVIRRWRDFDERHRPSTDLYLQDLRANPHWSGVVDGIRAFHQVLEARA